MAGEQKLREILTYRRFSTLLRKFMDTLLISQKILIGIFAHVGPIIETNGSLLRKEILRFSDVPTLCTTSLNK